MKRALLICLFVGTFGLMGAQDAKAFQFDLDATLGSSHTFQIGGASTQGPFANFGANLEIMPSLRFLIVSADLGIHYDFLQNNMTLRPGARLHFGWFYLRGALPMAFALGQNINDPFNMGILVGAGARIHLGKWAFVVEGNISPMFVKADERGVSMPAELRMGLSYRF